VLSDLVIQSKHRFVPNAKRLLKVLITADALSCNASASIKFQVVPAIVTLWKVLKVRSKPISVLMKKDAQFTNVFETSANLHCSH